MWLEFGAKENNIGVNIFHVHVMLLTVEIYVKVSLAFLHQLPHKRRYQRNKYFPRNKQACQRFWLVQQLPAALS